MISDRPFNPVLHDLFLYQDEVVSWTGGSATFKAPYAWNPNSLLYGYRRSMEGLVAPYRIFNTGYYNTPAGTSILITPGTVEDRVNQVNPATDPANRAMWWNSFPPTSRMISKKHLHMCGHCFGLQTSDRQAHLGQTLENLYGPGSYLDSVLRLRFIDGDNNILDIPKSRFEYPYINDSAASFTPAPNVSNIASIRTVSCPLQSDTGITVYSEEFPFNPITIAMGAVRESPCFYLNAGNMTIQRAVIRMHGGLVNRNKAGYFIAERGLQLGVEGYNDVPFVHDSGSLFCISVSPPTSPEAGDGVMWFSPGHLNYAPLLKTTQDLINIDVPPPHPFQTHEGSYCTRAGILDDEFRQYWASRGAPFPEIKKFPIPSSYLRVTKTGIESFKTATETLKSSVE